MRLGSSVLVLFVASACERQPASIKVKLPQDSFASVRMDPVVPPFEKKNDTLQLLSRIV